MNSTKSGKLTKMWLFLGRTLKIFRLILKVWKRCEWRCDERSHLDYDSWRDRLLCLSNSTGCHRKQWTSNQKRRCLCSKSPNDNGYYCWFFSVELTQVSTRFRWACICIGVQLSSRFLLKLHDQTQQWLQGGLMLKTIGWKISIISWI